MKCNIDREINHEPLIRQFLIKRKEEMEEVQRAVEKYRISMRRTLQRPTLIVSCFSLWHDKFTVFLVSQRNNHLPGLWANACFAGPNQQQGFTAGPARR